jgi:hypothetical protein
MSFNLDEVKLDGYFEVVVNTHNPGTGGEQDADSDPTYRVYEEGNDTVLKTGTLSKRDDANTVGCYYARFQVQAVDGFEAGKRYFVRTRGVVNTVAGVTVHHFKVVAELSVDQLDQLVKLGEADLYVETTTTPWELHWREKGTVNVIQKKKLYQSDGSTPVTSANHLIGGQVHTT